MVWPLGLLPECRSVSSHSRGTITRYNQSCIGGEASDQKLFDVGMAMGQRLWPKSLLLGAESRPRTGRATLNIETLATAVCSTGGGHDATEAKAGPAQRALAPVEQWNPPFCGNIDMRIAHDGTWFYRGTAIGRSALVRFFIRARSSNVC